MTEVKIYDTTLRDGAQREGISFTVQDKLEITHKLDELGIHFIEGGWPGANPKDDEFFQKAKTLRLKNSTLVAFGSTRRPRIKAENDRILKSLTEAETKVVTIVGKTWDLHVTDILETTLEENIKMVQDSIRFLSSKGTNVFFDAEHFFDGFRANQAYALRVLQAAQEAGAACIILCDTNGGGLPSQILSSVQVVRKSVSTPLGIHVHNDGELAVANTLAAVSAGVSQVQGTINGYGERCGNVNLCSVIPNLKLKMGIDCISTANLSRLGYVSHFVSEIANIKPDPHMPYVGSSAFSHKGGYHISAVIKMPESYQHIDPELVGNEKKLLISELAGKSAVLQKAREKQVEARIDGAQAEEILAKIKTLESQGFQYDGAEASFELLLRRSQPAYKPPFELVDFMVVVEKMRRAPADASEPLMAEATVKVRVGNRIMHTAAEGNGPVNALDEALRKGLLEFYPQLEKVKLLDYKVRILEESAATASKVRVLIESSDGEQEWHTVGSSTNIIEASWLALADSLEYWLTTQPSPGKDPPA